MDFRRGHSVTNVFRKRSRVTGEFRRSQIVTPVAAECIACMGVITPRCTDCVCSSRNCVHVYINIVFPLFLSNSGYRQLS